MAEPTSPSQLSSTRVLETLRMLVVAWLLLVGLWSGPVPGATLVYPNLLLPVEGVLLVVLVLLGRQGRVRPLRAYPFLWPCLGALALAALAAGLRVVMRGDAFDGLRLWRSTEPMFRGLLLYLAIAGQPRVARVAWGSMLAGLALLAVSCVIQHLTGVSRWYADLDGGWCSGWQAVRGPRVQGLTSYINLTAAMLAAAVPCWWALPALCPALSRHRQALLLAGGALTVAALWYTNSRGPLVALAVGACALAWSCSRRWGLLALASILVFYLVVRPADAGWALAALLAAAVLGLLIARRKLRVLVPIALALAMAGGLLVVDGYILHRPLDLRVSQAGLGDAARVQIYTAAVQAVHEAPWWGIGDQAIAARVIALPVMDLQSLPRTQRNAHNQYLQWAAAEGLPVALAFTLLVGWAVIRCRHIACRQTSPRARALGLAFAGCLAIFLLANLTDAHFWRIEGGGFFWALLAVGVGSSEL